MTTKFFYHDDFSLIVTLNSVRLDDYLIQHPALPENGWASIVPTSKVVPLHRVQGYLMDRGAEPYIVFRVQEQPVEVMRWPAGLVNLVANLRELMDRQGPVTMIA